MNADHDRALNCALGCILVTDQPIEKTGAALLQVVLVRPVSRLGLVFARGAVRLVTPWMACSLAPGSTDLFRASSGLI